MRSLCVPVLCHISEETVALSTHSYSKQKKSYDPPSCAPITAISRAGGYMNLN